MKVLIFGGTGFLGPHFVQALQAGGHQLTLFNRGKSNPGLFKDLETLIGDRDGKLDALRGRDWDVVIDDSGYVPRHVKLSADLLKDHVRHYIFVSSISVYGAFPKPGLNEDDAVATPPDPKVEEVTGETYAGLKAGCEKVVTETYGSRCTIVRPHYVVGPGDSTDRFTYWVARVARGGQVLAPGSASDPLQYIDVRDLAAFMRRCVEARPPGKFNACTPPGAHTMGELMETGKRVSGSNATFAWADAAFIQANGLMAKGEIPIWLPPTGPLAGALLVSSARAVQQGLRFRDLATTVRDTLDWNNKRPAEQRDNLAAGLKPEREAELLQQLTAQR
ncbi:MAG TPA: NAD-dependent epimerase/dehydratase family protein [Steroidobacteraceae bacterium]|nr:NAD-dependent epimerase/dehydratase family protein [Steroidobacteraceae bacterium]